VYVQDKVGLESGVRLVRRLHPGDHFGEIAVLYNCPRSATVLADNYSTLAKLSTSAFKDITSRYPVYLKHLKDQVFLYDDPIKLFLTTYLKKIHYLKKLDDNAFHEVLFAFR
jgi:CRP-like cAMP-binding protein